MEIGAPSKDENVRDGRSMTPSSSSDPPLARANSLSLPVVLRNRLKRLISGGNNPYLAIVREIVPYPLDNAMSRCHHSPGWPILVFLTL
jgi:hypothetical protein